MDKYKYVTVDAPAPSMCPYDGCCEAPVDWDGVNFEDDWVTQEVSCYAGHTWTECYRYDSYIICVKTPETQMATYHGERSGV